jgi:hypothetical protein
VSEKLRVERWQGSDKETACPAYPAAFAWSDNSAPADFASSAYNNVSILKNVATQSSQGFFADELIRIRHNALVYNVYRIY